MRMPPIGACTTWGMVVSQMGSLTGHVTFFSNAPYTYSIHTDGNTWAGYGFQRAQRRKKKKTKYNPSTSVRWSIEAGLLFHKSHRESYNVLDVKVTYALLCCTAALEHSSRIQGMVVRSSYPIRRPGNRVGNGSRFGQVRRGFAFQALGTVPGSATLKKWWDRTPNPINSRAAVSFPLPSTPRPPSSILHSLHQ
jgi:hypothetical protein